MFNITKAEAIRYHEIFKKMMEELGDEQAMQVPYLYEPWKPDTEYAVGQRVQYEGVLYKVLIGHTSQTDWTPDVSYSLFAKVLIPDPEVIPEWVQPDSTNPYMKGDKVMFEGKVYESVIDNNIWSPTAYPAGWKEVTE